MISLHTYGLNVYFVIAAAAVVGLIGTARFVRLVVADEFPPSMALRMGWSRLTNDGPWSKLFSCMWCFAPYAVAANLAWAALSNLHWSWWLFNGWLAASYLASWIVFHDED